MPADGVCSIIEGAENNKARNQLDGNRTGSVYTPRILAEWVASALLEHWGVGQETAKILDPACGDGELLLAVAKMAQSRTELLGVDINSTALARANARLNGSARLVTADAILPSGSTIKADGWRNLLRGDRADYLIANPPWGADLFHSRRNLARAGYSLAKGQFDSWDLFIEMSLGVVRLGGVMAFIIPDAIFLPEHEQTRRLLLERTTVTLIARLGEGFFPSVCRGTAIVVAKNGPHYEGHKTEVFRLDKRWRQGILGGVKSLDDARNCLSHFVAQDRFLRDKHYSWDIDIPANETRMIESISNRGGEWTQWLTSGRGVELSKKGHIVRCAICGCAFPKPNSSREIRCTNCGYYFHSNNAPADLIITNNPDRNGGWAPIIVGEDVGRYQAKASRQIRLSVPGINYKDQRSYKNRRLLVRKTGIGIKASIIGGGALTNQVVFHYFDNPDVRPPYFFLSYVLGVLCSRVMFAYHLRKGGENEWRSHPYLTQKVIARFPIPLPRESDFSWKQSRAIAHAVDELLATDGTNQQLDVKVECLVAGLFQLRKSDMIWVGNVINSAQKLEPMRSLSTIDLTTVSPVLA